MTYLVRRYLIQHPLISSMTIDVWAILDRFRGPRIVSRPCVLESLVKGIR